MWNDAAVVLTSVGFGGLLGAYAKAVFDKRQLKFSKVFEYKERRYQAIAILMWAAMNPTTGEQEILRTHRPELHDAERLERELALEYHNAMMFASKRFLKAFDAFLKDKDEVNWGRTMRAMKRDLYI